MRSKRKGFAVEQAHNYMDSTSVRGDFSEILSRVAFGNERVVVCRHGKEAAALVPMHDLFLLEKAIEDAEDRLDVAEAERILSDPVDGERVPRPSRG